MSAFLDEIRLTCTKSPHVIAYENSCGDQLTYAELDRQSDALASFLIERASASTDESNENGTAQPKRALRPVALRGHKQPGMIVGMLACVKAGTCYVPLESSFPEERVRNILDQLDHPLLIEVEPESCANLGDYDILSTETLETILASHRKAPSPDAAISGNDAQYILFTSGSTGEPKGVVQPARSMDHTYRYFARFIPESSEEHLVFFNRAHFSFDLSIFDLAIALPFGHTLFALDAETEESLARTFDSLHKAQPALWVSTPSYLNLCLADPSFNQDLLPKLRTVVVCGETLFNSTARKLFDRFPQVRLFNTYGPTEAQGAITDVAITPELLDRYEVLPVGTCSPYNELQIVDLETKESLPVGTKGEICILGGTIASGYYGRDDLTEKAFAQRESTDGTPQPAYFTGDKGNLDEHGMLWFDGRYDNQVKVNGYRVELQEVEAALNRIDEVIESCVTLVDSAALSSYLVAHLVVKETQEKPRIITKRLKEKLKERLPLYMIPRTFEYYDALPKSINGKIDRKELTRKELARKDSSRTPSAHQSKAQPSYTQETTS